MRWSSSAGREIAASSFENSRFYDSRDRSSWQQRSNPRNLARCAISWSRPNRWIVSKRWIATARYEDTNEAIDLKTLRIIKPLSYESVFERWSVISGAERSCKSPAYALFPALHLICKITRQTRRGGIMKRRCKRNWAKKKKGEGGTRRALNYNREARDEAS